MSLRNHIDFNKKCSKHMPVLSGTRQKKQKSGEKNCLKQDLLISDKTPLS